jgi:hypothetical protein
MSGSGIDMNDERVGQRGGFVAGTPVWTDQGPLPIERLKTGDRIVVGWADNNKAIYQPVARTFVLDDLPLFCVRCCDVEDQDTTYNLYCSLSAEIGEREVDFHASYLLEGGEIQQPANHRKVAVIESVPIFETSKPGIGWEPEYGHSVVGWNIDFTGASPVFGEGYAVTSRESSEWFKGSVHRIDLEEDCGFFVTELGIHVR